MLDQTSGDDLLNATVYDTEGNKIGRVGRVYLDDRSGEPEWVTVHTGLFGTKESFLPLAQARLEGEQLTVPIGKDAVKNAPHVDPDSGHLSLEEERQLYQHYGLSHDDADDADDTDGVDDTGPGQYPPPVTDSGAAADRESTVEPTAALPVSPAGSPASSADSGAAPSYPPAPPADSSRPAEGASGRSAEEQGGQPPPGLRLRRHLVTEQQQITVPVVREEYILESDPDADSGTDPSRPDESGTEPPAR